MIDVSLLSLSKRLEQEPALVPLVAKVWQVDLEPKQAATIATITRHMQDAHAARSVWEALTPSARLCLFHIFGSGNPDKHKGITLENLRKKTKLVRQAVEEATESLHALCLVEVGTMLAQPSQRKSGPSLLESTLEPGVFPYRECFQQLWLTGLEMFRASTDRSNFSLESLLGILASEQLNRLANLCHVSIHSSSYSPYSSHASPSVHPREIQHRVYEALQHPLMPFELLHQLEPSIQEVFLWLGIRGGKAEMESVRAHVAARTPASFLKMLVSLEAHALAFDTLTSDGKRYLLIPSDLLTIIKRDIDHLAEDEERYALRPLGDAEHMNQQPTLLFDLAIAISTSLQTPVEPTKEGKLPKRLREKIHTL